MGRRPGHLFHPAEGRGEGMLFGHGPVFRDFNFAMDPSAVETLLQMGLRIVFVPYGAARQVELTQTDLESLSQRGGAAAWVAQRSRGWLHYWNTDVGRPGFYPFDLLGAAYAIDPRHLSCARVSAWIGEDRLLWHFPFTNPSALLIEQDAKRIGKDARPVQSFYCPAVDGRLKAQLQQWLRG